jgi:predicted nucleotidyltransferase
MTADAALLRALSALMAALEGLPGPSMVIGGIAAIARGVPRDTVDIDAAVWAEGLDIAALVRVLAAQDIVPRIPDAEAFAEAHQVLLLRHAPTGTPLEVSLAWLPFEREAMDRASTLDFGGVRVRVASPEDLVVYKAVAWRDRDRADVERLLLLHVQSIDLERVRGLVRQFAEALDEPERIAQFDALVRRTLPDGTD